MGVPNPSELKQAEAGRGFGLLVDFEAIRHLDEETIERACAAVDSSKYSLVGVFQEEQR